MERTFWLDRKFNFDFPIGLMPNILERLRGTTPRIKKMMTSLDDEEARQKFDGKWSFKEQAGHLADLETLHIERLDDFMEKKETLRAADMTNLATNEANHNQADIWYLLNDFARKRSKLVKAFEKLDDETHNFRSLHPRLQVMVRPVDIAYFIAEHDDHHLASAREILKRLKN